MIEEEKKVDPEVKTPQDLTGYHFTIDSSEYKVGKMIKDIGKGHLYKGMEIACITNPCAFCVATGKPIINVNSIFVLCEFLEFMDKRFVGVEQLYAGSLKKIVCRYIRVVPDSYFCSSRFYHAQKLGEIKNEK